MENNPQQPPPPPWHHPNPNHCPPPPPQPYHHHHPQPPWPPAPPDYSVFPHHQPPPPPAYNHHPWQQPQQPPFHALPPPGQLHPHAYPPQNQAWANQSWHQHQGWEHSGNTMPYNHEEDWAAKARAWAEAKSPSENSHMGHMATQFTPTGRNESQNHVQLSSFQQVARPSEVQQASFSGTQQFLFPGTNQPKQTFPPQHSTPFNLDPSYTVDARTTYDTRSEGLAPEGSASSPKMRFGSSVIEQEVPSSYSSISGRTEGNQPERMNMPFPLSTPTKEQSHNSQYPSMSFQPTSGEQQPLVHKEQFPPSNPSDQPLVFERSFAFDHGQNQIEAMQPAIRPWAPTVPFTQIPSAPSGQQNDSSYGSLPSGPALGRIAGSTFHLGIPSPRAPFGLGVGAPVHHLPVDASAFIPVERPKKTPVPNWLREELIKKKTSMASSLQEQHSVASHIAGNDEPDQSFGKVGPADGKSNDSSRSDDDVEDEDGVEAARSAAINQEIKRVLTDILLKVTDELFEDIANKVIAEDSDLTVAGKDVSFVNQKPSPSPSPQARDNPKSGKVTVPVIGTSTKISQVEKSSATPPIGTMLGLVNYASDDEDEETQTSDNTADKVTPLEKTKGTGENSLVMDDEGRTVSLAESFHSSASAGVKNGTLPQDADHKCGKDGSVYGEDTFSVPSRKAYKILHGPNNSPAHDEQIQEKIGVVSDSGHGKVNGKSTSSEATKAKSKSGSSSSPGRSSDIQGGTANGRKEHDSNGERQTVSRDESKANMLQKRHKAPESGHDKSELSESRKRSSRESGSRSTKGSEKDNKTRSKEESDRNRGHTKKVKEDEAGQEVRSSHKSRSRHSPSPSNQSRSGASRGELAEDSKRRSKSKRSSLSPSPPRSRTRQVSRSPPSKHSQRRHSPNSYSDPRRRSRSRSPVRRRR